jgi:NAD(P)-dependent dehydrogenase (short-subunit alcohol dehydrogenase family)
MPDRAALITGGSSGIGFAIARMLGKDLGYGLTVNGRRPDKLEEAVNTLKEEGIDATAAPGIQPEDIAEAVRFLLATSPACIVPEIQFIRPGDTM